MNFMGECTEVGMYLAMSRQAIAFDQTFNSILCVPNIKSISRMIILFIDFIIQRFALLNYNILKRNTYSMILHSSLP